MPVRRQAIIWINDSLVHWHIYASLGLSELNPTSSVYPKNFHDSSNICLMGFMYSIQTREISHRTFRPSHRKCPTCPMIFVNTASWKENTYLISQSQYHGCWWPGYTMIQGNCDHGIHLVFPEHSKLNTRGRFSVKTSCLYTNIGIPILKMSYQAGLILNTHTWQDSLCIKTGSRMDDLSTSIV